jgi:uncharacterized membrane protein YjfL (UPF0719 family)
VIGAGEILVCADENMMGLMRFLMAGAFALVLAMLVYEWLSWEARKVEEREERKRGTRK